MFWVNGRGHVRFFTPLADLLAVLYGIMSLDKSNPSTARGGESAGRARGPLGRNFKISDSRLTPMINDDHDPHESESWSLDACSFFVDLQEL